MSSMCTQSRSYICAYGDLLDLSEMMIVFACVELHLHLLMCGSSAHEFVMFLWRLYFIELLVFHYQKQPY
jgi:hypothetical protein